MTDAATTTATEAGGSTAAPAQAPAAATATTATLLTGTPATTTTAADATAAAVPAPGTPEAEAAAKAAADAKAAEAKAAGAPEKYEAFTIAEGFEAKPEQLAQFGELAKSLNLNQANAQKLVDEHIKAMTGLRDSMETARIEMEAGWRKATESDKDFGGANLPANLALASKALQQFGTPELTKFLTQDTKLGDHPEILRLFARVGKALGEDTHIAGGVTATPKTAAQVLFDKSTHN